MYVLFRYVYEGLCILVCLMFKLFISALYACSCSWGYYARMFGDSRVLFTGLRVGDVIVWYQSSRLQHGPKWAMKGQLAEVVFLLPSRKHKKTCAWQDNFGNSSKYWDHRIIGGLSLKSHRCIGSPKQKVVQQRPPNKNIRYFPKYP